TVGRLTGGAAPENDLPVAAPPAATMPDEVASLLTAPDLEISRGQVGGTGSATVLASRSADMAVISMTGIPEPAEGRAYQLWLMGPDHDPIPAGTMESGEVGPSPSAELSGIRGSAQIGITEEPAGGSPAPTGDVLLALDLA
ncbi:anti-sigma factor, partial [Dietzia sp. DQ12-76]